MPEESSTARLIRIALDMNPAQQFELLKELLGGGIESHLLRLLLDLPEDRKLSLVEPARQILRQGKSVSPAEVQESSGAAKETPLPGAGEESSEGLSALPRIGDREHARVECEIPVGYAGEDCGAYGTAQDISVGGMRINTSADLKVGQQLQMNFPLPGGEITVRTSCRVIRVDRTGVAVAFVDLAPWIVEQIRRITGGR